MYFLFGKLIFGWNCSLEGTALDSGFHATQDTISYSCFVFPIFQHDTNSGRYNSTIRILWAAKSDVSFALQVIPLKALPVLVLGGFTSIPGAIIGGLIIGLGEKLFDLYWGAPILGGGTESWFAFIIALIFLLYRPEGLFGEKLIERI